MKNIHKNKNTKKIKNKLIKIKINEKETKEKKNRSIKQDFKTPSIKELIN